MKNCHYFAAGMCKYGNRCKLVHDEVGAIACSTCLKPNCRFVHGGWMNASTIATIQAKCHDLVLSGFFSQINELRSSFGDRRRNSALWNHKRANALEIRLLHYIFDGIDINYRQIQYTIDILKADVIASNV